MAFGLKKTDFQFQWLWFSLEIGAKGKAHQAEKMKMLLTLNHMRESDL